MSKVCRYGSSVAAVVLVLSLGACGGDSPTEPQVCQPGFTGTPPNCVAIPPPCTQTVVESGQGGAEPRTLYHHDFSVPDSGRLDTIVDWTNASSPVGVYLVPANTCTLDEFNARSCNFLIRSEPSTQKPRKISTPNFAAGNYRWLMGTYGTTDESLSYQFVLSKGSCPALTGTAPQAHALDESLPFERMMSR